MMLVLYRKYRPKNFSEVIGQDHIVKILKNALRLKKTTHAYLFYGPRGVGKTTVARLLAKSINCENLSANSEPCNRCVSCEEINEAKTMDLIEIDAASNRGIDEIRELRERVKFSPGRLKYKVFIIDEVHMLTNEAFNALLKTLEEPPAHCLFILATTASYKVPATILSRCQCFDFRRLSTEELKKHLQKISKLEGIKIDEASLSLIAQEAQGAGRDALSILGQIMALEDKKITIDEVRSILMISDKSNIIQFFDFLVGKKTSKVIEFINDLLEKSTDLKHFMSDAIEYCRQIILLKVDLEFGKEMNLSKEQLAQANKQAQMLSEPDLIRLMNIFIKNNREINIETLPQLALEMVALEWLHGENQEPTVASDGGQVLATLSVPKIIPKVKRVIDSNIAPLASDEEKKLFDSIKKEWNVILAAAQTQNFSLFAYLKSSAPTRFKGGYLTLACHYDFHKERLEEIKIRNQVEKILAEKFSKKILVNCRVDKKIAIPKFVNSVTEKTEKTADSELLGAAEEILGGA